MKWIKRAVMICTVPFLLAMSGDQTKAPYFPYFHAVDEARFYIMFPVDDEIGHPEPRQLRKFMGRKLCHMHGLVPEDTRDVLYRSSCMAKDDDGDCLVYSYFVDCELERGKERRWGRGYLRVIPGWEYVGEEKAGGQEKIEVQRPTG